MSPKTGKKKSRNCGHEKKTSKSPPPPAKSKQIINLVSTQYCHHGGDTANYCNYTVRKPGSLWGAVWVEKYSSVLKPPTPWRI